MVTDRGNARVYGPSKCRNTVYATAVLHEQDERPADY